jgi:hypothetical protein
MATRCGRHHVIVPFVLKSRPIYIYVFIHSSITNHNALYHYINDWKDPSLEFDPVIHMISFYEGFLRFQVLF